jgi:hypothetical protein
MTTRTRAERYIASLHRWVTDLRRIAQVWDSPTLDERERQSFPVEWDNALDRLTIVDTMLSAGELSSSELVELRALARELDSLQPVMERLRLRVPDSALLARALGVQAA